ncbi:MAG: SGNH/GDSL hydrolase family protein [Polyangiaceae bacterium]
MTGEEASRRRVIAELLVVAAGLSLLGGAWALNVEWLERRFGLETGHTYFLTIERAILIAAAVALIVVARPKVGRWTERVGTAEALGACFRIGLAFVLAIVASEVGLRILKLPRRYDMAVTSEALGETNPRYGWLFKASKSITIETAGRPIRYDFNAEHNRARSVDDLPDPSRPSLLFVGESITTGHGLQWDESYPAIVGEALNLQVVNLGVEGYASDQAFLRLLDALPRFEHPVAIVTLFLPGLVNRVERVDHPRMVFDGAEVKLVPPGFVQSLRLTQAFRESFDFHPEWAIQTTAEVFQRTARLAKERGARAIFVTPYLGTNWPRGDGYLVQELLVREGLTVVDPNFGFEPIPGDNHPNVASTRRLAEAIISTLQAELAHR